MNDYYIYKAKKVGDIFLGIGYAVAVFVIVGVIFNVVGTLDSYQGSNSSMSSAILLTLGILLFLLSALGIMYFFRIKRRFIAIGIIIGLIGGTLIPFLAYGACIFIFGTMVGNV